MSGRLVVLLTVSTTIACGPTVGLESGGTGSASDGTDGNESASASADETGSTEQCGVNDVELIGGGMPGPSGFPPPCSPRHDPGVNGYRCCSDDPAAANGELPAYQGTAIVGGMPYFSEANNDLSTSGQCMNVAALGGTGLVAAGVEGCPIPCNPTWPESSIEVVCGIGTQCCQTMELEPRDCVIDPDTGLHRPANGYDIPELTDWSPARHLTHQDPNGRGCTSLSASFQDPVFEDCVRTLSVADQRGYCMSVAAGQVCPLAVPGYVDACEALN